MSKEEKQAEAEEGENTQKNNKKFSIFVVDDEENTRRSLSEILRLEGYQVSNAANAAQAIQMIDEAVAQSTVFDVILLDLRMPTEEGVVANEQSGLIVLRHAAQVIPDTQVIFLTAHGSLDSAIVALRHSALDYLLKPASPEQILDSVAKALERRKNILQQRHREISAAAALASGGEIAEEVAAAMSSALQQLEHSIHALRSAQNPNVRSEEAVNFTSGEKGRAKKDASLLHREAASPAEQQARSKAVFLADSLVIDLTRREIWQKPATDSSGLEASSKTKGSQGSLRISLTPTEGKLMQVLINHPGKVFSHRELVALVQGYETTDWEAPEVLRPLISRLRQKLESFPNGRKWIRSIRGTGYVFEIEENA